MDNTLSLLTGLGLGAGMMYILDPQQGLLRAEVRGTATCHQAPTSTDPTAATACGRPADRLASNAALPSGVPAMA